VLRRELQSPSPLVRAAAAEALGSKPSKESAAVLVTAAGDDYRLVRIKAAASLAMFPRRLVPKETDKRLEKANAEYRDAVLMEPDRWGSWLTVGNDHLRREEYGEALAAYRTALTLKPQAVNALLNQAFAQFKLGDEAAATTSLATALQVEPDSKAALTMVKRFSFGSGAIARAEKHFASLVAVEPKSAQAAYGLCMTTGPERNDEALSWCRKAVELAPADKKYAAALEQLQAEVVKAVTGAAVSTH